MMHRFSQTIDLSELSTGEEPRVEQKTKVGRVISGGGVCIGAGKWRDHSGLGHVAIRVIDPCLPDGEPRYYLVPRGSALELAQALQRAASEVAH